MCFKGLKWGHYIIHTLFIIPKKNNKIKEGEGWGVKRLGEYPQIKVKIRKS